MSDELIYFGDDLTDFSNDFWNDTPKVKEEKPIKEKIVFKEPVINSLGLNEKEVELVWNIIAMGLFLVVFVGTLLGYMHWYFKYG